MEPDEQDESGIEVTSGFGYHAWGNHAARHTRQPFVALTLSGVTIDPTTGQAMMQIGVAEARHIAHNLMEAAEAAEAAAP